MSEEGDELLCSIEGSSLILLLDEELYPRDAIYGACYLFIDRCFVFLERPEDRMVQVRLPSRKPDAGEDMEKLAGEFANELLNQVIRFRLGVSTSKIREYYMARAFASLPSHSSIDALLAELDAEELAEDDLEISVPWEQGDG